MVMMVNSKTEADAVVLPGWFSPSKRDIICGWARQNHKHIGNQRFRKLIDHSAPLYVAANSKKEKTRVIASVVRKVRLDSPAGGFVKRDLLNGFWFEIGDDRARDKVGHAIRRSIEDSLERKSKSKSATNKRRSQQKKAGTIADDEKSVGSQSSVECKILTLTPLDDFLFVSDEKLSGTPGRPTKNVDVSGGGNRNEFENASGLFMQYQTFLDKEDSLAVPFFLYQQGDPATQPKNVQQREQSSSLLFGGDTMRRRHSLAADADGIALQPIALQSSSGDYLNHQTDTAPDQLMDLFHNSNRGDAHYPLAFAPPHMAHMAAGGGNDDATPCSLVGGFRQQQHHSHTATVVSQCSGGCFDTDGDMNQKIKGITMRLQQVQNTLEQLQSYGGGGFGRGMSPNKLFTAHSSDGNNSMFGPQEASSPGMGGHSSTLEHIFLPSPNKEPFCW